MAKTKKQENKKVKKQSVQQAQVNKSKVAKKVTKRVIKVAKIIKQENKKTKKQARKGAREKNIIAVGGMAFSNGLMVRSYRHAVVAIRDEIGKIEVFTFRIKKIRDKLVVFTIPFFRGIFFILENIYLTLKISSFKGTVRKKTLGRKPKYERFYIKLNRYFLYLIYSLLFVGFFDYLFIKLNIQAMMTPAEFIYSFFYTLLYLLFFIALFSLLYFGSKQESELFNYHAVEHRVINAYERFGKVDKDTLEKSINTHDRCGVAVYFWGAVILAFLLTLFRITQGGWLMSLFVSVGLFFISFSISYEFVKLVNYSKILSAIFIKPLYIIQYLTSHNPDYDHLHVGEVAFNELIRIEKEK